MFEMMLKNMGFDPAQIKEQFDQLLKIASTAHADLAIVKSQQTEILALLKKDQNDGQSDEPRRIQSR